MALSLTLPSLPEDADEAQLPLPEKPKSSKLDQTRQFDQIIGVPGICWTQDNKLFNRVGYEVDRDGKLIDPDDAKHVFDTPVGEEKPVVVDSRGVVPLAHLTDVHLKALVESYGEEYVNRDDALAYLQDMLDASSMHA